MPGASSRPVFGWAESYSILRLEFPSVPVAPTGPALARSTARPQLRCIPTLRPATGSTVTFRRPSALPRRCRVRQAGCPRYSPVRAETCCTPSNAGVWLEDQFPDLCLLERFLPEPYSLEPV